MSRDQNRSTDACDESSGAITRVVAVPAIMLGVAPEPKGRMARGAHLVAYAEAAKIDPFTLADEGAQSVLFERMKVAYGL